MKLYPHYIEIFQPVKRNFSFRYVKFFYPDLAKTERAGPSSRPLCIYSLFCRAQRGEKAASARSSSGSISRITDTSKAVRSWLSPSTSLV